MPNYQKMYSTLFQCVTAVIDMLQQAQRQTEELYLSAKPAQISVFSVQDADKNEPESKN